MTSLHTLAASLPGIPCTTARRDYWYSDQRTDRTRAAALCRRLCPLAQACAEYAADSGQQWGVWGGVDFDARFWLVEAQRRDRLEAEHAKGGSLRGYDLHWLLEEEPCDGCREARAAKSRERRGKGRAPAVPPPTPIGARTVTDHAPGAPAGAQPLSRAA